MKIVTYSVVLNQHQAPVADALWELTGHQFTFVELINLGDTKGGTDDYSKRPYLLRAWESQEKYERAMELARSSECCIFSGVDSLPFEKERMRLGLLSFDMGERWLKKGWKSLASPRLLKWLSAYYLNGWKHKPLYKLCMSAFAAEDHYKLGTFKGKAYKWGYFTSVPGEVRVEGFLDEPSVTSAEREVKVPLRLMWCARMIEWKHPELPILLADRLMHDGFDFTLEMYGDGAMREDLVQKTTELGLTDCVRFHGNVPNEQIHQAMREHDIFLFTSDRGEGWGAVANEAMSEGCLLIGSDEIGAVPYLVKEEENGLLFESNNIDSLYNRVIWAFDHPKETQTMRLAAMRTMQDIWNPRNAAQSLLNLIDDLQNDKEHSTLEGPCSKA